MKINKIGIIGAGLMGCDIAIDLASKENQVILVDLSEEILNQAKQTMQDKFRLYQFINPEMRKVEWDNLISKISFQTDLSSVEGVDLIIENIIEDEAIKLELYRQLNTICPPHVIYAVNTSCISITRLSGQLDYPEKMIGAHFFNPVPLKNIVELIEGLKTSPETISQLTEFLKSINKQTIVVKDFPGFVSNRLSHLFMNEAAFLIQDGVSEAKDIDLLFREGFGHKMGPLETADLIGLDTVLKSLKVLYEDYQDPKFRCCPLLKKMVDAGWTGKKSGQGFYKY